MIDATRMLRINIRETNTINHARSHSTSRVYTIALLLDAPRGTRGALSGNSKLILFLKSHKVSGLPFVRGTDVIRRAIRHNLRDARQREGPGRARTGAVRPANRRTFTNSHSTVE